MLSNNARFLNYSDLEHRVGARANGFCPEDAIVRESNNQIKIGGTDEV